MKDIKIYVGIVLVILASYLLVYKLGYDARVRYEKLKVPIEQLQVSGDVNTKTITKIVYAQKTVTENADINMNFAKQDLVLKVNGIEQHIVKADNESYVFDKNQLRLDQTSTAKFELVVTPIDETKHYGIGIGVNPDGLQGIVTTKILKYVDGYVDYSHGDLGIGVMVRF